MLVDIDSETADIIALASLKEHYEIISVEEDNKLLKALKRVIEYYGGNVDNE